MSLKTKLLVLFMAVLIAALSGIFVWLYRYVGDQATEDLRRDANAAAVAAAAGINGIEHQALVEHGKIDDATYAKISAFLRSVRRTNPKAVGLYTYVQSPNEVGTQTVRLVVSSSLPPGQRYSGVDAALRAQLPAGCLLSQSNRPSLGLEYDASGSQMVQGLHEAVVDRGVVTDRWGSWLSGYAPIRGSMGQSVGAVGIDLCAAQIEAVKRSVRERVLPIFAAVLALVILVIYLVSDTITKPILALAHTAANISRGRYDQDLSRLYQGRVQDEVSTLAQLFGTMSSQVKRREDDLKGQVQELKIVIDETKRAKQIAEIVETDFFRDLKSKAQRQRERRTADALP